jgi:hypothetical protein
MTRENPETGSFEGEVEKLQDFDNSERLEQANEIAEGLTEEDEVRLERILPIYLRNRKYLSNGESFRDAIFVIKMDAPRLLKKFINQHWEMLKEVDPEFAIQLGEYYKDQPYAKEIFMGAVEKVPNEAFDLLKGYADLSYIADLLLHAIDYGSVVRLGYISRYYRETAGINEVFLRAARVAPNVFIPSYPRLKRLFPDMDESYLDVAKATIKTWEQGENIPSKMIESSDFPMNKRRFGDNLNYLNYGLRNLIGYEYGPYCLFTIPLPFFKKVFFSDFFQKFMKDHAGEMTYMNAFSIVQAVYRKLIREDKELSEINIEEATGEIHGLRDKVRDRELFGPNTKLILFTHEEESLSNNRILNKMYGDNDDIRDENVLSSYKGIEEASTSEVYEVIDAWHAKHGGERKERYLKSLLRNETQHNLSKVMTLYVIANAKGNTTIFFSGHGFPENWYFSGNQNNGLDGFLNHYNDSLSYENLGDALIESGNIENFNLISSACYTYDYLVNLFKYLESKKIKEKPCVSISTANKGRKGIGNKEGPFLLNELYSESEDGDSIIVDDLYKAEGRMWKFQDPALFVGSEKEISSKPKYYLEISSNGDFDNLERLV